MESESAIPVSDTEIDEIELRIDGAFNKASLPTESRYSSRRAVLTATEDQLRLMLLRTAEATKDSTSRRGDMWNLVQMLDRTKYSLKAALSLIDSRIPERNAGARSTDFSTSYTRAAEFVFRHCDAYATAVRVMSPLRAGIRDLMRTHDGNLFIQISDTDRTYPALEGLINADDREFSAIPVLVALFRGIEHFDRETGHKVIWSPEVRSIVNNTERRKHRIKYSFVIQRARWLLDYFQIQTTDLPNGWVFPWATAEEAEAVFNALQVRAFYHLIAIHFGAARWKISGMGVAQICLETTPEKLSKEISQLVGLPVGKVRSLLKVLIYGSGVNSPDPALQPLIPVNAESILLPPFLILSSAWARNLLALHARLDPASFDAQSHQFEATMVQRLAGVVPAKLMPKPNLRLLTRPKREEVDLVLVDSKVNLILLCELRWMLHPGEIREVLQRQKVCADKAEQVRRKRDSARENLGAIATQLKLDPALPWRVEGIVVIDNYGGVPSAWPKEIPIVPRKVFEKSLDIAPDLDRLHATFTTTEWLPRNGTDFLLEYQDVDLGGVSIRLPMFRVADTPYMSVSVSKYIGEACQKSADSLRSAPW